MELSAASRQSEAPARRSREAIVPLDTVRPHSVKRPKGFATYNPRPKTIPTANRILDLYERMRAADALPLGPRTVGYRLKELYPGEYGKDDFKAIEEIVKRLAQAERIPFNWVADASSVNYEPGGWDGSADFLASAHELYQRNRRTGQSVVVEVYAEARETLPLIRQVAAERGATVYSGGGSSGPNIAQRAATRALARAVEHGQSTVLLGVCDFDQAGVANILRPHIEHVAAFLYTGSSVVARRNGAGLVSLHDIPAEASFKHLAITAEMALDLVETDHDREQVAAYIASGADVWTRDLDLIAGVQKIELEALDPPALRELVAGALDATIDRPTLEAVAREEQPEREEIRTRLAEGSP